MGSKTDIANRALMKLGQPRVSNVDIDGSPSSIAISAVYDAVRLELLQSYNWNFAVRRANVAAAVATPEWGYASAFAVPSDCLRIIEINDVSDYSVENFNGVQSILCDEAGPIYIRYVSNVSDAGLFTPLFSELFAISLATEVCERIADDDGMKQNLILQRKEVLNRVTSADAIENPTDYFDDDDWITARL